jgi:Putative metallopeptidase
MKRFVSAATLLLAVAGASSLVVSTGAQTPAPLDNKQVDIAYVEPTNINHRVIYQQLKDRRILEQLKQFLAPLRLPEGERLKVQVTGSGNCEGPPNAWFNPSERTVSICYQYIDWYRRLAPRETTPEGLRPEDALVGTFLEVLFHELGHAVFFLYKVPIFGHEEDAADQISAYILTQFGPKLARRTLLGVAHFNDKSGSVPSQTLFADTHSTDWQRFYNNLCIAYGAHPETFQDLVDKGLLPKTRAPGCAREFRQVAYAFQKHIAPHIDPVLLREVQRRDWVQPRDGTCVVERC